MSSHIFICWLKNTWDRWKKENHSFHLLLFLKSWFMYPMQRDENQKKEKLNHSNKICRHFSDLPNKCAIPDKWEMCIFR